MSHSVKIKNLLGYDKHYDGIVELSELIIDKLSDAGLASLISAATEELNSRREKKKASSLEARLKRIKVSNIDNYADGMASYYTSPTAMSKFAGGFFVDGNKLYAKTKTGVLYRYDSFNRRWTVAPGWDK
jgi:hypothetical protein